MIACFFLFPMVRPLLALVVAARAVTETPTCQQADETSLLQASIRHREAQSLGGDSDLGNTQTAQENPNNAVVEWAFNDPDAFAEFSAKNPSKAASWEAKNADVAADWAAAYPDHARIAQRRRRSVTQLSEISVTLVPDTKCMDGSPAGYYADITKDSDVWVIFLEGGGGCNAPGKKTAENPYGCGKVPPTGQLRSSKTWEQTFPRAEREGTLDTNCEKNPDFCEANHVFVKYCSQDSWQGTRTEKHEGFYISGHLNFKGVVEHLLASTSLGSASRVLLTGQSAGGNGVIANADFLTGALPGVTVKASPIGGWFLPDHAEENRTWMPVSKFEDFVANKTTDPQKAIEGWQRKQDWNLAYNGNCPISEGEKCTNFPFLARFVETPMLVSNSMWDKKYLQDIYGMSSCPSTWSDAEKEWIFYYAKASQASLGKFAARDGNGLFLPACMDHVGRISGKGDSRAVIDDLDYLDVLADWFYDRGQLSSHVVTDACDSYQSCMDKLDARCPRPC